MKQTKTQQQRRRFLKQSGAAMVFIPSAALMSDRVLAADEMVDPESAQAVALKYIIKTTTEGQKCINCALYQNGDETAGDCPLFQGVKVGAEAWCSAWAAKA